MLLIYLSLSADVSQLTAQGINLLVFVPTAAVAVIIYAFRKNIAWKKVLYMAPLGVLGSLLGAFLVRFLPAEILQKILGGVLIVMGLTRIFARKPCKEDK